MARLPRYATDAKVTGGDLNLILAILDTGGVINTSSLTNSGTTGDSLQPLIPDVTGSVSPPPGSAGSPATVRGLTGAYGIDNFSQSHTAYVLLGWTPNPVSDFISRYDIYYHKGSDPTLYNLSVGGDVNSARINNLFPGNTYSFSVQAHDATNRASLWCKEIDVAVSLDSDPPAVPTGLTATATGTGVYLHWTEVGAEGISNDLKQYYIAISTDGGATYPSFDTTGPGNDYFWVPTAASLPTMFFKIATVDWTGNMSDFTAPVSAAPGTLLGPITINPGPITVLGNSASNIGTLNAGGAATASSGFGHNVYLQSTLNAAANNDSLRAATITNMIYAIGAFTGAELIGLHISGAQFTKTGAATPSTAYGLVISAPTIATTNRALYITAGNSLFGESGTAIISVGTDNLFGAGANGGSGTYVDIGSLADPNSAWIDARGSGADVYLNLRSKGASKVTLNAQDGVLITNKTTDISSIGLRLGTINASGTGSLPDYGSRIEFSGGPAVAPWNSDNSDALWMSRYNASSNVSELRIGIGDDAGTSDALTVGVGYPGSSWAVKHTFDAAGNATHVGSVTGTVGSFSSTITAGDGVTSNGSNAALWTADRGGGASWALYSTSNIFRIYNGSDRVTVNASGSLGITAAASKIIPGATNLSFRNNADSADNLLITDAGDVAVRQNLTHPTKYKASAYRNTAQNLVNNTLTLLQFDTENYDPNNNFDITTNKGRYTCPVAGKYLVCGAFQVATTNTSLALHVYKNGGSARSGTQTVSATSSLAISAIMDCAVNDYLELFAYQNRGSDQNSASGSVQVWVDIHYLST